MKIYYVYDPKTYAYAGQVACDNQPESASGSVAISSAI